jgi:Reverse transcriptase (RNA-dependent DNA polymerase)
MPAEFLRNAYREHTREDGKKERVNLMAPVLTRVFNAVLSEGYPSEIWGVSALVPVPKPKGRPDVQDDYRGIAVGPVLGKLYSLVLMARLDKWAEVTGKRADGQAGFRAGRGAPDNCFILRHAVDKAAVNKRPLYCCFIDFSKAYDRIDRALLWRALKGMGLHGPMLATLMQMYDAVWLQVRANGQLGEQFESEVGVKQGDPLSPLLFGLYIDRLERYLEQACPQAGARLGARLVRILLYADDIVLMASSPQELKDMLGALGAFCNANSMFVNLRKTKVVVFNKKYHSSAMGGLQFSLNGEPIEEAQDYVYLGLGFADGKHTSRELDRSVGKARQAMFAMFNRCYELGLHNVDVQGHLFDALVRPILSYGCEVWGPDWISPRCDKGDFGVGLAESDIHRPFMRQALGVNTSTPSVGMMAEMGREPVMLFWLRMAAQLWNKAVGRPQGDLLREAMEDNVACVGRNGLSRAELKSLWAHHFIGCMDSLGLQWKAEGGALMAIPIPRLLEVMRVRWERHEWAKVRDACAQEWARSPRAVREAPSSFSEGFKLFTYQRWFSRAWVRKESCFYHLNERQQITAVAQFRLGSHWLMMQKGRCQKPRLPRGERVCQCCSHIVEDEMHVLECPRLAEARLRWGLEGQALNSLTDGGMRLIFNPKDQGGWAKVANFLKECRATSQTTV